ncbi:hypothetical protein RRG08_065287 [Elysia crispata]|uniref:Uncharacterized protein n=1 Tax=Elysia crispata TaxID=231223 RepID=A0AAE0YVN6_9GAST|nr:hypothetical protein RRG08_065287 [Elysia crispata]
MTSRQSLSRGNTKNKQTNQPYIPDYKKREGTGIRSEVDRSIHAEKLFCRFHRSEVDRSIHAEKLFCRFHRSEVDRSIHAEKLFCRFHRSEVDRSIHAEKLFCRFHRSEVDRSIHAEKLSVDSTDQKLIGLFTLRNFCRFHRSEVDRSIHAEKLFCRFHRSEIDRSIHAEKLFCRFHRSEVDSSSFPSPHDKNLLEVSNDTQIPIITFLAMTGKKSCVRESQLDSHGSVKELKGLKL